MRVGAALGCASAAAVLACGGGGGRVWLQPGSGAETPAFGLSLSDREARPFPLGSLQVHSCGSVVNARSTSWIPPREQAAWYIDWWPRDTDHPAPEVELVTYGRLPEGMQQDRPAEPLGGAGGCYVVQAVAGGARASKAARTAFRVTDAGVVRELTPAQIDSIVDAPAVGP